MVNNSMWDSNRLVLGFSLIPKIIILTDRQSMEASSKKRNRQPAKLSGPPPACKVMFFFYDCNIFLMYNDPVCNMMVDEEKTQYISQAEEGTFTYALLLARVSLRKIPANMAINIRI